MSKSASIAECTASVPDEQARVELLRRLAIIDTPPEAVYDALTRMASAVTGRPISLMGLVGPESTWFKSIIGLESDATPNRLSFCARAVEQDGIFEVTDARADPRFSGNPLVTHDPRIVFYAGVPLKVEGVAVGTLCVVDRVPYELSGKERALLLDLAVIAEHTLMSRSEAMKLATGMRPVPGT